MANPQTSRSSEPGRSWIVDQHTHWHHGFAGIGSDTYLYGPLGSSGFLEPQMRQRPRRGRPDTDDTATRAD